MSRPRAVASIRAKARPFDVPGLGPVAGLGEAAQHRFLVEGAVGADVVCGLIDETLEDPVPRQSKDIVDTVVLAPLLDLRPAIVAIAAEQDASGPPAAADAPDEAA